MKKFDYGLSGNKIYKTLGFKDQEGVLEEVKHLWDEKTHCKPKVITIQEAIDNGWMTKSHWKNQCIISEDILTYKVWYLYTDIRRNGVWSPPNGVLREQDRTNWIHFHPGPNRVKALCMLGLYDTNLVIWDPMNRIDKPELSFDEWLSCFFALEQTTPSFKYSYIAQVLHRGHSPLSYSHAAVLHPEFSFGFA